MNPLRRIGIASVGILAVVSLAACSSTETKAKSDVKKVDSSLHSDVVKAYDDAKADLDKVGDKISDVSKSAYDKSKKDLESLGGHLEDASSKVGDDAKRAYRDVQHDLDRFDREADRHMHNAAKDFTAGESDAWSDIKDDYHHVKDSIDNVVDKL